MRGVHEGKPFTHVVFRRTRCLDCGQCRVDREWVNEKVDTVWSQEGATAPSASSVSLEKAG